MKSLIGSLLQIGARARWLKIALGIVLTSEDTVSECHTKHSVRVRVDRQLYFTGTCDMARDFTALN